MDGRIHHVDAVVDGLVVLEGSLVEAECDFVRRVVRSPPGSGLTRGDPLENMKREGPAGAGDALGDREVVLVEEVLR